VGTWKINFIFSIYQKQLVQWRSGKALDLRSIGHGFNFHWDKVAFQPWTSFSHLRASVTKQYNLVLVEGRWRSSAGKVTTGQAEVMAAYLRRKRYMQADSLYTGISSGPCARLRVWANFTFMTSRKLADTEKRSVWDMTGITYHLDESAAETSQLTMMSDEHLHYSIVDYQHHQDDVSNVNIWQHY